MSIKDIAEWGGAMFEQRLARTVVPSALAFGDIGSAAAADTFPSRAATDRLSSNRNDRD
jgi:hypothetical protein